MDSQLKKNLSSAEYWFRAVYSVLFLLCAKIAGTLILLIALAQIIFTLVTARPNARLVSFGGSLAKYIFTIFNFVTCKSEDKPFPFADWPEAEPITDDVSVVEPIEPVVDTDEKTADPDGTANSNDEAENKGDNSMGKATQDT